MSESIDRRVVEMRFDNKDFEQNANTTLTILEKLKEKMAFKGAGKNFEATSGLSSAIDGVKNRFSALEVIGTTALVNLTNSAVNLGKNLAKSLTVDQVRAGFSEYELKMNSIQTIMASSHKDLDTVNGYLNELNTYADKTIYSFSDMTASIGKFTNAGVDLDLAVKAIQGISNEAALSGANAQEASRAMYNFSQALSAGYVKLIDWKSIENANMATKDFKDELIKTAVECGTLEETADGMYKVLTTGSGGRGFDEAISATKNFNDSLSAAWMTNDVLNKTLARYADETTDIGKRAFAAAQDVKTFSQLLDTVKEAIGSGWAQTFELLFGNLDEAKELWTGVNNVISGFVDATSKARNDMLKGWKDFSFFGGPESSAMVEKYGLAIGGLNKKTHELTASQRVLTKVADTGFVKLADWKSIENAGEATTEFKQQLLDTAVEMGNLEKNADGTYKVLTKGGKNANKEFRDGISATKGFNGSLNEAWLTSEVLSKSLERSSKELIYLGDSARDVLIKSIGNLFKGIGNLVNPIKESFKDVFSPITSKQLVGLTVKFAAFSESFSNTMKVLGNQLKDPFKDIFKAGKDVIDLFKDALSGLFDVISGGGGESALHSAIVLFANFIALLARGISAVIAFARASGVFTIVHDLLVGLNDILFTVFDSLHSVGDGLSGVFSGLSEPLSRVSKALNDMFSGIGDKKVKVVDFLASSFGKLFSLIGKGLSHIDIGKLGGILAGGGVVAVGAKMIKFIDSLSEKFDKLFNIFGAGDDEGGGGPMDAIKGVFESLSDTLNQFQTSLKVGQLVTIAISLGILAAACSALADIPAKKLAISVGAIGGLFTELGIASHLMTGANTKGIISMSIAVVILAKAVKQMSEIQDMGKGLLGVGAILGELTAFCLIFDRLKIKPKALKKTGEGLILMAVAINLLVKPVKELGSMDTGALIKGLLAMASMLGGFTLTALAFSKIETKGLVKAGAAMVVMAVAMRLLVKPISQLGSMDMESLAKGLGSMGVALIEIAGFTFIMGKIAASSGNIMKASAALLIMSIGIKIMAGAIGQMGADANAGQGLSVLFGSLLILGAAMAAMQNSLAGAAAMIVVAGALAIMAPSIALLSSLNFMGVVTGLAALAGTLAVFGIGAALLTPVIPIMIALGAAMALLGVGVLSLGAGLTLLVAAFSMATEPIIEGAKSIAEAFPIIAEGIGEGIIEIIKVIGDSAKEIAKTFEKIVNAILDVFTDVIPDLVTVGLQLILALLDGINSNIGKIASVAVSIITNFINGIADGLPTLVDAGFNLIITFLNSMADAISQNGDKLAYALANVILAAIGAVAGLIPIFGTSAKQAIDNYRLGLDSGKDPTQKSARSIAQFAETGLQIKNQYSNGANAVSGLKNGLESMKGSLKRTASAIGDIVDTVIRKRNMIRSPSRRLFKTGTYLMQGLIGGVDSLTDTYQERAENISTMMISSANKSVDSVTSIFKNGFSDGFDLNNSVNKAIDVSLSMGGIADQNAELAERLAKLTDSLDGMTDTMNSRSLNVYNTIDGSSDPEAFADGLVRSFRLNARTV